MRHRRKSGGPLGTQFGAGSAGALVVRKVIESGASARPVPEVDARGCGPGLWGLALKHLPLHEAQAN